MKLSAVQFVPVPGDIASNTRKHLDHIERAVSHGAHLVFFPELSLTGYEPRLAKSLAIEAADPRLDVFQRLSDLYDIRIGVGAPLSVGTHVQIGMLWFQPKAPRVAYAKQQLHSDELPFFVPGSKQLVVNAHKHKLAPAICYESLQPSHARNAASMGADVYLASVAKPAGAMARAMPHYSAIARKHDMYVIMADCVGPSDNFVSVGQSAVWSRNGEMLAQMDSESEGMVIVDTNSGVARVHLWINR